MLGQVAGVGNQERVLRRGRELAHDTQEVEGDDVVLLILRALEPQVDLVADLQLEVLDRLCRNQHAVGGSGQGHYRRLGVATVEVGVGETGHLLDALRVNSEHILQVAADIGEAVHQRLGRRYLWQQKLAVKRLASHIPQQPGLVLGTARSIYMVLTEVASDQRTPTCARAANAHLAKLSGYSADTVHRYIREFERIGIVTTLPGRGQYDPNTYVLLLLPLRGQIAGFEAQTLPLADAAGRSRGGTRATPHVPLSDGRGGAGAGSEPLRGGIHATQIQNDRLRTKRTNKQAGVAGLVVDDPAETLAEQPATQPALASSTQIPHPTTLTTAQQATAQQLTAIGVQRRVAQQLVLTYSAEAVSGWLKYTRNAKGITSPAGFVLAKLRAGDEPPRATQPATNWLAEQRKRQEEEARRLLTRYGVDQPTLVIWLIVLDRLQAGEEQGAYLCFKDAFLACPDAQTALLVLPSRVPLEQAASFAPLLLALLAEHLGADVQLSFEHPRPGDEPINFAAEATKQLAQQPAKPEPALAAALGQPPTAWMEQVWVAAADDLRHLVGNDLWHSWLAQVRLVGRDGDCWLLRQPSGNVPKVLAERWGEQIAALLASVYGRAVRLSFTQVGTRLS